MDLWKKCSMEDRIVETQNNTPTPRVIMFNQSNFKLLYLTNPESFPSQSTSTTKHTVSFPPSTVSEDEPMMYQLENDIK